jgi:hypothetical protein
MSLLESMIRNAVAEEVRAYSAARATMRRQEAVLGADGVLTERITRLVLGQILEWVSAATRPSGKRPSRTAYARLSAGESLEVPKGTPRPVPATTDATAATTVTFPRVPVGGGYLQQLPPGHVKCEACGRVIPLERAHGYHPDGAPDVLDYVCGDTASCLARVQFLKAADTP